MAIGDHYGREQDEIAPFEESPRLRTGLSAGFLATLVSGVVFALTGPELLRSTIPGMYGFESALAVGIGAHLIHGTIFGLAFALVLSDPQLVSITNSLTKTTAAGLVYGVAHRGRCGLCVDDSVLHYGADSDARRLRTRPRGVVPVSRRAVTVTTPRVHPPSDTTRPVSLLPPGPFPLA